MSIRYTSNSIHQTCGKTCLAIRDSALCGRCSFASLSSVLPNLNSSSHHLTHTDVPPVVALLMRVDRLSGHTTFSLIIVIDCASL